MLPEDEKRLQREADIAKAKRGPDYSMRDKAIAKNKAAQRKRDQAQAKEDARDRAISQALWAAHNRGAYKASAKLFFERNKATRKVHNSRKISRGR